MIKIIGIIVLVLIFLELMKLLYNWLNKDDAEDYKIKFNFFPMGPIYRKIKSLSAPYYKTRIEGNVKFDIVEIVDNKYIIQIIEKDKTAYINEIILTSRGMVGLKTCLEMLKKNFSKTETFIEGVTEVKVGLLDNGSSVITAKDIGGLNEMMIVPTWTLPIIKDMLFDFV